MPRREFYLLQAQENVRAIRTIKQQFTRFHRLDRFGEAADIDTLIASGNFPTLRDLENERPAREAEMDELQRIIESLVSLQQNTPISTLDWIINTQRGLTLAQLIDSALNIADKLLMKAENMELRINAMLEASKAENSQETVIVESLMSLVRGDNEFASILDPANLNAEEFSNFYHEIMFDVTQLGNLPLMQQPDHLILTRYFYNYLSDCAAQAREEQFRAQQLRIAPSLGYSPTAA